MSNYSHWPSVDVLHHLGELGLEEARNIWPTKKLDILVMLGSSPPHLKDQKSAPDVDSIDQSSRPTLLAKATPVLFQLNSAIGSNFGLEDLSKIAEISRDIDRWLAESNGTIVEVANRLVAGLFFYTSSPLVSVRLGTISCRLPFDLKARMTLVAHLITVVSHRKLFIATYSGTSINVHIDPTSALGSLRLGQDLFIEVKGWNAGGRRKLHISMADVFGESDMRYPISGSS
jgi:hypothetical protein